MPGVAELVDAHKAAFGTDFVVLRSIEYSTRRRITRRGFIPYEFPEDLDAIEQANKQLLAQFDAETNDLFPS